MVEPGPDRTAFTLTELMAVIAIAGLLAAIVVPLTASYFQEAQTDACHVYRGNIELQVELWRHNTGSWPATNLSDIGADLNYFPDGIPVCPVDGTAYAIDAGGRVVGHDH